ncbi:N-6 DNA methylase [Vibrio parahaemolyticus]|nr:N-6 DNA methylase [Vibrio parahaemolyticus]
MQTAETAMLFLQLIMRKLKRPGHGSDNGGRAAVVVPNGTLFSDGISARIKEELLKNFNLHTIVRLPEGAFSPYTEIPTNVLFFDRSGPTSDIWFYEVQLPDGRRKYTKTKPMESSEFDSCLEWIKSKKESQQAWKINATDVIEYTNEGKLRSVNLDVKNPFSSQEQEYRSPQDIIKEIWLSEQKIMNLVESLYNEIGR